MAIFSYGVDEDTCFQVVSIFVPAWKAPLTPGGSMALPKGVCPCSALL